MSEKDKGKRKHLSVGEELDFFTREAFNALRTNISLSVFEEAGARVIGITSPSPKDGKSYTSVNLAYALAKNSSRVLLINGDLRLPSVEKYLNLPKQKGLSNVLVRDPELGGKLPLVTNLLGVNLSVLPVGDIPPNPSELLGSSRMGTLLSGLRQHFDYIIVDLPPVSTVIDAVAVSPYIDGMLVVVRQKHSRKRDIRETIGKLRYADVRILGFVQNGYQPSGNRRYYYY